MLILYLEQGRTNHMDVNSLELLRKAKQNVNDWFAWWGDNNSRGQDDRRFLFESQWDEKELRENQYLGKAQLQFNKIYDFYRKALAEQRKNTVSIKLRATDNATGVDQKTIDLHESLLRSIAYDSKADVIYQTAFASQLHTGYGAIRVKGEWEHEKSFNQKIVLEAFENPERCFWDPSAKKPCKSDGDYCGVFTTFSKDYFKKLYPDVDVESIQQPTQQNAFAWVDNKTVTVVEYYYKEYFDIMIYQLANGEIVTRSELNKLKSMLEDAQLMGAQPEMLLQLQSQIEVVARRKSKDYRIKSAIMVENTILEEGKWPIKQLPIVYVDGDSYWDREKQYTQSFVRHAKDAQRFLNYCAIEIATALKNSRKETFLVTPHNVKGFEKIWKNPEKQQGALLYNMDPNAGAPQKLPPTELSQSLLQQYQRAELDLQSILGIYEAARGEQGNETSGVAIANRAKQSHNSMFVFFDNLNRAVEQVGRIVLELMPIIYDTERPVNVVDANGQSRPVVVNQYDPMTDTYQNQITEQRWDLRVNVGASFEVQKQEALNTLVQLTQVSPDTFPMVADLIAENLDLRNTPQLVERFKNFVPEQILAKEAGKPPPEKPPSPQEQMMEAQMKLEQEKIQVEEGKLQSQQVKNQVDMIKAMADLYEIPQQADIANTRAAAEMQKSDNELQADMAKAYADTVKAMSQIQKAASG